MGYLFPTQFFWSNALAAVPLALLVAAICRWLPCRPATRHVLWLTVLLFLVLPPVLPHIEIRESPVVVEPLPSVNSKDNAPVWVPEDWHRRSARIASTGLTYEVPQSDEPKSAPPKDSPEQAGRGRKPTESNVIPGRPSSPNSLAQAAGPPEGHLANGTPLARRPKTFPKVTPSPSPVAPAVSLSSKTKSRSNESDAVRERISAPADHKAETVRAKIPRKAPLVHAAPSLAPAPYPSAAGAAEPLHAVGGGELPATALVDRDNDWRNWLMGLLAIRDAVGRLPSMPPVIWLIGVGLYALAKFLSVMRCQRLVHCASPAPLDVLEMVELLAREVGLRRAPATLMVDRRVSPMVACGRRPVLLLPHSLWAELELDGRRSVICHELAHLRRYDHWVCWFQMAVGALYWWHPLVWWVRGRVGAEAELCCDAWVTWVMPRQRKAYAHALLVTKQFVDQTHRPLPAGGIGVTTGRAGRFGRRLTMVMKDCARPRLSPSGIVLAGILAAIGWMAAPARSCPESDGQKTTAAAPCGAKGIGHGGAAADCSSATPCVDLKAAGISADKDAPCAAHAHCKNCRADAPCASCRGAATSAASRGTSFGQYLADRGAPDAPVAVPGFVLAGAPGDDEMEARLSRLEEQLERLAEQLEGLGDRLGERSEHTVREPRMPRIPREPREPRRPRVPMPPRPPLVPGSDGNETVSMSYSLPEGKLQALTALMSRSDVPILVSPQQDRIEVHATPAQHVAFGQFVNMINAQGDESRSYGLSIGKLQALTELMIRSDVPIHVTPGDRFIRVNGSQLEQEIFRSFVELIEPGAGMVGLLEPEEPLGERAKARAEYELQRAIARREAIEQAKSEKRKAKPRKEPKYKSSSHHQTGVDASGVHESVEQENPAMALREKIAQIAQNEKFGQILFQALSKAGSAGPAAHEPMLEQQAVEWQAQAESMRAQAAALQKNAGELEANARLLEDQASELDDRADALAEEADQTEVAQRNELLAKAETLLAQSGAIQNQIHGLESQAEDVTAEAAELHEQADSYEETAAAIRETVRVLAEQAEGADEE